MTTANIFENRIVLVTGASGGIGNFLSRMFEQKGACVIFHYYKNKKSAELLRMESRDPDKHIIQYADIRSITDVEMMFNTIQSKYGRLDILINNAGIYSDALVDKMSLNQWKDVIDVNLNGVFYCSNYAVPMMKINQSGKIINITSIIGEIGIAGAANYAASKAGVIGFTKALAKEMIRNNIYVYGIALGYINTGMLLKLPEKMQQTILNQIPMKRFGKVEEVADVVAFLSSEFSDYLTGQIINLNGGLYI